MNYKDAEVLEWVNSKRERDGKPPLQRLAYAKRDTTGMVAETRSENCPIARSLGKGYHVGVGFHYNSNDTRRATHWRQHPTCVAEWITEFDAEERTK